MAVLLDRAWSFSTDAAGLEQVVIGRCLINRGADLDPPSRGGYYTNKTEFALVVGKSYLIYAMGLWRGGLEVLVRDETALPNWYGAVLFEIPAQRVPDDWEFVLIDGPHASGHSKAWRVGRGALECTLGFLAASQGYGLSRPTHGARPRRTLDLRAGHRSSSTASIHQGPDHN